MTFESSQQSDSSSTKFRDSSRSSTNELARRFDWNRTGSRAARSSSLNISNPRFSSTFHQGRGADIVPGTLSIRSHGKSTSSVRTVFSVGPRYQAIKVPKWKKAPIEPEKSRFFVVHHGDAYKKSMDGYHGMTLQKAQKLGKGKDDPMFNPFEEDELKEQRLLAEEMEGQEDGEEGENDQMVGLNEEEEEEFIEDDEDEYSQEITEEQMSKMSLEELALVKYNADGSIRRKASQKYILSAGAPAGGTFAIVEMAGSQFKVTQDDLLIVHRLKGEQFKVGSVHAFDTVMLAGSTHLTLVGAPYVRGAKVHAMVEEITMDKKDIIFKKRRRKSSQRKRGYRRDVTFLRISDIEFPEEFANHEYTPRIKPDLLPPRRDPRLAKEAANKDGDDDEEEGESEESDRAA